MAPNTSSRIQPHGLHYQQAAPPSRQRLAQPPAPRIVSTLQSESLVRREAPSSRRPVASTAPYAPVAPRTAQPGPRQIAPMPRLDLDREFPIDGRRAVTADPRLVRRNFTLVECNYALSQVRADINKAMSPMQRHAARILTMSGVAGSVAGGVMMGLFAATALAAIASTIGAPVAALAAAAAALITIGGVALTILVSAMMRAIVRQSMQSVPGLDGKIKALQAMRQDLWDIKRRTPAEKALLRNINIVLGKVEEANNNMGSQAKTALKTMGMIFTGGLMTLLAAFELATSSNKRRPILGGRTFGASAKGTINLPNASDQLETLVAPIAE